MNQIELTKLQDGVFQRKEKSNQSAIDGSVQQHNPSPDWHFEILEHRLNRLNSGQEKMMPLAHARLAIQQEVRRRKQIKEKI